MSIDLRKLSHVAVLVAVACDGKLMVDRGNTSAGSGGGAGRAGSSGLEESAGLPEVPASAGAIGGKDALGESDGIGGRGGSGGFVIPPDAGKLGRPCLPGGIVTESEGIATDVETLRRCYSGLACNAEGECVAAPDCQTSEGVCVVRPDVSGGARYGYPIVALAADDSRLYWLDYGTNEGSGGGGGTYQHDGALLAYSFADRRTATIASGLDGPVQLAITTTHAYLSTYSDWPDDRSRVLRVPLTGGNAELVQEAPFSGPQDYVFATAGSQAFWSDAVALYSMTEAPDAIPTLLTSPDREAGPVRVAASDGLDVFYWVFAEGRTPLRRTPIGNFAPTDVGVELPVSAGLALHGEGFYTLTRAVPDMNPLQARGIMLSRAAKSGGEFKTIRSLGDGVAWSLQSFSDRYFFETSVTTGQKDSDGFDIIGSRVLMASFDDNAAPIRLLERPLDGAWREVRWVPTAHDLFWTDGKTLYQHPLPVR